MPAKKAETTVKSESKIQFFGEVDLNDQGGIASEMPAWYFDVHIEKMSDDIGRKERQLERGQIELELVPMIREEIKREKAKLKKIIDSKPSLSGAQKDRVARAYESIGRQIKDTMPTRKETKQGLVSPHDELARLKGKKHIKIDPSIASACGVKPVHGKITGNEANKCYQILGKALGENTNVERLRRDGNTEAYKTIHDLTKAILDGKEARGT
jgi:hypothetical protein